MHNMVGRRSSWFWGLLVLGLALLAGCARANALPVTGGTGQAAVDTIEVVQSLSQPGDVRLLIKGALPDTCTQLVDPVVSRSGGLVVVILLQQPLAAQKDCRAGAQPFERMLSLGSDLASGRYTASVNGKQQVFDLSAPAAARPSSAASAPKAELPAAAPAATQAAEQALVVEQAADQKSGGSDGGCCTTCGRSPNRGRGCRGAAGG